MKKTFLILSCIALAAVAVASPPVALLSVAVGLLLWPACKVDFRADPTPRSIRETRRMGLA